VDPSARREELPPWPPRRRPPSATPDLALREANLDAWRLHRGTGDPLDVPQYPTGRYRFDSPDGAFRTTYANTSRKGCIAEIYADDKVIERAEGESRHFFRFGASRPLKVIALDEAEVRSLLGLDLRVCSTLSYERTQAWAKALYAWYPEANGIRYLGRNSAPERNYCLFLDRFEGEVFTENEGQLRKFRRTVQAIARAHGIASEV
jgi:hypothetical protein